jgi:hypothetical protein
VEFVTVDEKPSGVCIWIWLDSRGVMQENYAYSLDRCPSQSDV